MFNLTNHINLAVIHQDSGTQEEGKHQLVFLKKATTDVTVQAEGEELINVENTLLHCLCGERSQDS